MGGDGRPHDRPGSAGDLRAPRGAPGPALERRARGARSRVGRRRGLRARAVRELVPDAGAAERRRRRSSARCSGRTWSGRAPPTSAARSLPFPAHPAPRRRVRRRSQGRPCRAARDLRRPLETLARRARRRVRRVHRATTSSRRTGSGPSSGATTSGHSVARQPGLRAPGRRGPTRVRARRHGRGREPPRPRIRAASRRTTRNGSGSRGGSARR